MCVLAAQGSVASPFDRPADGSITGAMLGYAKDAVVVAQRGATDAASGTNLHT
jgi:hypothetical protein